MSRWPFIIVAILVLLPVILMAVIGGWAIWWSGHWFWLSWAIPVCWTAAWLIVRYSKSFEIPLPEIRSRIHWTPRDRQAAEIIEAEQKRVGEYTGQQLTDPQFYTTRSIDLATRFAKFYYPKTNDPLGAVSVVELLTAIQLVAEDMEVFLRESVPGSHLVTVSQWRSLAKAPEWWRLTSDLTWLASIVINPAVLARFAVSKAFVDPLSKQIQTNMLGAFYVLFVQQLGYYLIELNSGRLRGGSARYRAAMQKLDTDDAAAAAVANGPPAAPSISEPVTVTIAIIGQVKAGKSSLVNCLLGEQRAAVDVLPLTRSVERYELKVEGHSDRLILLDTPGYSDSGATAEQLIEAQEAVRSADLVFLVLDCRSPAKQADVSTIDKLREWFQLQHRLKPPPIIGVISKIDGLSPVMEWSPPYSWENPSKPKEHSLRGAMDYVRQTFGDRLASIVPVCTDRENHHVFGVEEYLLPTLSLMLDEARAVSLVRTLHRDYDKERVWQVFSQLKSAGARIVEFAPQFSASQIEQAARSILTSVLRK